jgi:hypothetical protein
MALYPLTGRPNSPFHAEPAQFHEIDDCCQSQNAWLTRLLTAEDAWQALSGITSAIAIETDIPRRIELRQRRLKRLLQYLAAAEDDVLAGMEAAVQLSGVRRIEATALKPDKQWPQPGAFTVSAL